MIAISIAVIMALHGNVKLDLIFRGVYFHFGVSGLRASAIWNRGCPESVGFFKLYNPPTGHGLFAGREPSNWDVENTGHQSADPLDIQTSQEYLYIMASPSGSVLYNGLGPRISLLYSQPGWHCYFPAWLSLVAFATLPAVIVVDFFRSLHGRRQRKKIGLCRECGYDLRESPVRCPECGTLVEPR